MLGRELDKSEQVHHKDFDKRNFHWTNLLVCGEKDHGWVSARQAWYMAERDRKLKKEWDEFMDEQAKEQPVPDGALREAWEERMTEVPF
jgi:hypothetical protein